MHVHTIPATIHGRYVVRDGPPERLLLGFHGYAQTAEKSLADLELIPGAGDWQGAAMAYRAAAHLDRVVGIIALGADVPADVTGPLPALLIGRGERDQWYGEEKFKKDLKSLEGRAVVRTIIFDGVHEWTDAFRSAAGEFLARLLTRQY